MAPVNRRCFLKGALIAMAAAVAAPYLPATTPVAMNARADQFFVGDVLTIEGRYATNPVTGLVTPHLQKFMVTAVYPDSVKLHPQGITVPKSSYRFRSASNVS
jgi:hypothetical protein